MEASAVAAESEAGLRGRKRIPCPSGDLPKLFFLALSSGPWPLKGMKGHCLKVLFHTLKIPISFV